MLPAFLYAFYQHLTYIYTRNDTFSNYDTVSFAGRTDLSEVFPIAILSQGAGKIPYRRLEPAPRNPSLATHQFVDRNLFT